MILVICATNKPIVRLICSIKPNYRFVALIITGVLAFLSYFLLFFFIILFFHVIIAYVSSQPGRLCEGGADGRVRALAE